MRKTIDEEIKSSFSNDISRALVNILFTSSKIKNVHKNILGKYDLSLQQFNILRILKGQKGNPVTLKLITSRMISPMSNTSRLIDKLIIKGWVAREQNNRDRRAVKIYITEEGLSQVNHAKEDLDKYISTLELTEKEKLQQLNEACDLIRSVL